MLHLEETCLVHLSSPLDNREKLVRNMKVSFGEGQDCISDESLDLLCFSKCCPTCYDKKSGVSK